MIWLGTETSFDAFLEAQKSVEVLLRDNPGMADIELPEIYSRIGDVGVISINGSLINGDAGWLQLFGVTGYQNITDALIQGIQDQDAKSLVLHVDSPGGSAKGVRQVGELIANVGKVKHTSVYADNIGSAAYWLGSAGGHITLDEMGEAGSIGAIMVHTEYSKALAQEGITKTVIRAGEYKALGNPIEPLSDVARADMQQKIEDVKDLFVRAVANNRGVSISTVENTMGQGRVFMGSRALGVRLVDSIGTFEDALAYSVAKAKTFKPTKTAKV